MTIAEGSKEAEGERSRDTAVPVRQPRQLGCLAVMLLASSIAEVKLGVPALSIRLGLQVSDPALMPVTQQGIA